MRTLMWFTIGFAVACGLGIALMASWLWLLGLVCLLFGVCVYVLSLRLNALRIGTPVLVGLGIGLLWFGIYSALFYPKQQKMDTPLTLCVQISDYSQISSYGAATDGRLWLDGAMHPVRVFHDATHAFAPGDRVSGTFIVEYCLTDANPYPKADGIHYTLTLRSDPVVSPAESLSLLDLPAIWRNTLKEHIDASLDEQTAAFCKALLLGDRSGLSYQQETDFRLSGIAHIVAVSGLHVNILFGLIDLLTARRRRVAALLGIPALFLFAALVGFTPSVTRACVMQILLLLASLFRQDYDRPTALSFSCLVMLVVNPMTLLSVSFQMSVGCIIGILLFAKPIYQWFLSEAVLDIGRGNPFSRFCKHWLASSVSVSISTAVITVPLVAYYFETVSFISLLTNLLVLWVVGFVFYGILLVCLFCAIAPVLTPIAAYAIRIPVAYILAVSGFLGRLPLAAVFTQSPFVVIWLVGVYGLLVAFLLMKKKPVLVFSACAAVSLCVAVGLSWGQPYFSDVSLTVLDVGQGQCLLLQSDGRYYMIDCGGGTATADLAADTLMSRGIFHLDGILLTHYDADHCDGLPAFLTRMDADFLLLPYMEDSQGVGHSVSGLTDGKIVYAAEDMVLTAGKAKMHIFAPEIYFSSNESSLSILFSRENCDILITGDRNTAGELRLLQRYDFPEVDVLVAGHHGAQDASCDALLQKTSPEQVFISCGPRHIYGHPSAAFLERMDRYGCIVYATDAVGTFEFRR